VTSLWGGGEGGVGVAGEGCWVVGGGIGSVVVRVVFNTLLVLCVNRVGGGSVVVIARE